jgi:GntR family transcriptional regulator
MDPYGITQRLRERLARQGEAPVSHLIVEDLWLAVVEGTLESGTRLPTARQLAVELGVGPRSVERAYEELLRRGVLSMDGGRGTAVALAPPPEEERARYQALAALCRDAVQRAGDLGFSLDELMDELAEYRTLRDPP